MGKRIEVSPAQIAATCRYWRFRRRRFEVQTLVRTPGGKHAFTCRSEWWPRDGRKFSAGKARRFASRLSVPAGMDAVRIDMGISKPPLVLASGPDLAEAKS